MPDETRRKFTNKDLLISNCKGTNSEWKFRCPLQWDFLLETEEEGVRFCGQCEENVYHITSDEELGRAIRLNQCVAISVPEELAEEYSSHDGRRFVLGRPKRNTGRISETTYNLKSRVTVDEEKRVREKEKELLEKADEQKVKEHYQEIQRKNLRGRLGREVD
jgi:hypothetical protein